MELKEGKFKPKGRKDVLSMALGKEPRARTRLQGTGKFLKPSLYYHFYSGNKFDEEYHSPWQSHMEAQIERGMNEIRNLIDAKHPFVEQASCSNAEQGPKSAEQEKLRVRQLVAGDGGEVRTSSTFCLFK